MSAKPHMEPIRDNVSLADIESVFRKHWRSTVGDDKSEAVLKASTLNLIIFVDDQNNYDRVIQQIDDIISHHPGRIILAYVDPSNDQELIDAHVSAYSEKSESGIEQISAEFIILKTGESGSDHLAGAILPLLLPDLPVYFWCTTTCVLINPKFAILFNYTDRLIISTPPEYPSKQEFAKTIDTILTLSRQCKLSDLSWSQLTEWREAVAQFFDTETNRKYLSTLGEIEIVYSGEHFSNHAFLISSWLSAGLKNLKSTFSDVDDSTIYYRKQSEHLTIKIRRKQIVGFTGLFKVKLYAEENDKAVICTASAQPDGSIQTTIQKGGKLYAPHLISSPPLNEAQILCNELDFLQQDQVYLNACENLAEYLHEN